MILNKALFSKDDPNRYELKMDTLRDLVLAKYGGSWSKKEKRHFDFLYTKIKEWDTFFFSYTNKGSHILNQKYKECIDRVISKNISGIKLSTEDWEGHNLVAEAMIQALIRHNFKKGFYDKRDIEIGDHLDDTIKPQLCKSFLFIQLVTMESFLYDDRNWSFAEYDIFSKINKELTDKHPEYTEAFNKRIKFTIVGSSLEKVRPKGGLPDDYLDWYDHISIKHYESPSDDPEKFLEVVDEIADSMMKFLEEHLISNIPS